MRYEEYKRFKSSNKISKKSHHIKKNNWNYLRPDQKAYIIAQKKNPETKKKEIPDCY